MQLLAAVYVSAIGYWHAGNDSPSFFLAQLVSRPSWVTVTVSLLYAIHVLIGQVSFQCPPAIDLPLAEGGRLAGVAVCPVKDPITGVKRDVDLLQEFILVNGMIDCDWCVFAHTLYLSVSHVSFCIIYLGLPWIRPSACACGCRRRSGTR